MSADLSTKKPCVATLSGMSFVMGCMYAEYRRKEALVSPIPLRNYHIARDEEVVADLLHGTLTSAKALVAPTTTMTPSTPLTNVPSEVSITPKTPPSSQVMSPSRLTASPASKLPGVNSGSGGTPSTSEVEYIPPPAHARTQSWKASVLTQSSVADALGSTSGSVEKVSTFSTAEGYGGNTSYPGQPTLTPMPITSVPSILEESCADSGPGNPQDTAVSDSTDADSGYSSGLESSVSGRPFYWEIYWVGPLWRPCWRKVYYTYREKSPVQSETGIASSGVTSAGPVKVAGRQTASNRPGPYSRCKSCEGKHRAHSYIPGKCAKAAPEPVSPGVGPSNRASPPVTLALVNCDQPVLASDYSGAGHVRPVSEASEQSDVVAKRTEEGLGRGAPPSVETVGNGLAWTGPCEPWVSVPCGISHPARAIVSPKNLAHGIPRTPYAPAGDVPCTVLPYLGCLSFGVSADEPDFGLGEPSACPLPPSHPFMDDAPRGFNSGGRGLIHGLVDPLVLFGEHYEADTIPCSDPSRFRSGWPSVDYPGAVSNDSHGTPSGTVPAVTSSPVVSPPAPPLSREVEDRDMEDLLDSVEFGPSPEGPVFMAASDGGSSRSCPPSSEVSGSVCSNDSDCMSHGASIWSIPPPLVFEVGVPVDDANGFPNQSVVEAAAVRAYDWKGCTTLLSPDHPSVASAVNEVLRKAQSGQKVLLWTTWPVCLMAECAAEARSASLPRSVRSMADESLEIIRQLSAAGAYVIVEWPARRPVVSGDGLVEGQDPDDWVDSFLRRCSIGLHLVANTGRSGESQIYTVDSDLARRLSNHPYHSRRSLVATVFWELWDMGFCYNDATEEF